MVLHVNFVNKEVFSYFQIVTYTVLCIILLSKPETPAQNLPSRGSGSVADFAEVLENASEQKINMLSRALWEQASFGLVVVTVKSTGSVPIEEYAVRLYEHWGIGKKGSDEGALVLLSTENREVRIEIGYGAEGYLNDAKVGRILDKYGIPYFKNNQFSEGLLQVSLAISETVTKEKGITLKAPTVNNINPSVNNRYKPSFLHLFILFLILTVLITTRAGRSILWLIILSSLSGGRGGFGSGSFGGGGFGGGFGGGRSGGGGASRGF